MAQSNGRVKPKQQRTPPRSAVARSNASRQKPTIWKRTISITTRLLTCATPKICTPYLTIRGHISPVLQPYYAAYAEPYVDRTRPYVKSVDDKIISPAYAFGKQSYDTYGAPRIASAQQYGIDEWQKTILPRVAAAKDAVNKNYELTFAPLIERASAVGYPYYAVGRDGLLQTYHSSILPAYEFTKPYATNAYQSGHKFAVDVGIPNAQWAWGTVVVLFDRTIWPRVRILYGENVEPQLVRIGERLGRYRDGKRVKSATKGFESSTRSTSTASKISSIVASASVQNAKKSAGKSVSTSVGSSAGSASLTPEEAIERARDELASDLKGWQNKFAAAADTGADDLEVRVTEIVNTQISRQVDGLGKALIVELEETMKSEVQSLKKKIISIVKRLSEHPEQAALDKADDELSAATRAAGLAIRGKAQALRTWKQKYERESDALIGAAAAKTLRVIDEIRDLGLQELGMKWAWMDGVTYKDWTKYHELRETFNGWRNEVALIPRDHKDLSKIADAGNDLEEKGMKIAENAAKELARLKDVGKWKIQTQDTSDDFSSKYTPPVAVNAGRAAREKVQEASEAILGTSQGTAESVTSRAAEQVRSAASSASSQLSAAGDAVQERINDASAAVLGTSQGTAESLTSLISEQAKSAASSASSQISAAGGVVQEKLDEASAAILGTSQGTAESLTSVAADQAKSAASSASSHISVAGDAVQEKLSEASAAILGTSQGTAESLTSVAVEQAKSAASSASSQISVAGDVVQDKFNDASAAILGTPQGTVESLTSRAAKEVRSAASSASSQVAGIKAGHAVQEKIKDASEAILGTSQGTIESISSVATEQVKSAVASASSAGSAASSAVVSAFTPPPSLEEIFDAASLKVNAAVDAASAQIYGTSKGTYEKATSAAAEKYNSAQTAASEAIYGTQTGYAESAQSQILDAASSAQSAISVAFYGSQTGTLESISSNAASVYSAASSSLSDQASSVSSAASSAIYGPEQGTLESAQSRLSTAVESAKARLAAFAGDVGDGTQQAVQKVQEGVESLASEAADTASSVTAKVKDEL
ncbi:MAG: hypothetical protein M1825_004297 [Sarcosagium campestre]|nr:MAG: hypothetical protein M1825_004297 [Sarcosagium campestre]